MSYLEIKNLEISFPTPKGKYIAVRDINLSIKKGEIISIIGHSGCGKSTIMNAIGGMLTPTGGTVELDNKKIKELPNTISARQLLTKLASQISKENKKEGENA